MADPRVQNVDNFTPTQHHKPGPILRSALDNTDDGSSNTMRHFRVCIIGASTAIGKGLATSYAKAGCKALLLAGRDLAALQRVAETVRAISRRVNVYVQFCDITSASDVHHLACFALEHLGGFLDVVAINSGYSGPLQLKITDNSAKDGEWAQAFAVNVQGTYNVAHYFVPMLLASPAPSDAKSFIVVGSIAGAITKGAIANSKYCISKMAQTRIVEHLACQFGGEEEGGLFAVAVHPGAVLTETAAQSAPEEFKPHLIDDPELCGAFCVWLTRDSSSMRWLNGRLLSATWDPEELLSRKEDIIKGDLLKYEVKTH
ncbi:NAD(P)-binding protein [Apiospora arundinis]|uniref:NAD(P)-binding protein n=1 Tax=Apiospora arundinis TaxID=335852 RepID=A0ABR2JPD9_9PEZI